MKKLKLVLKKIVIVYLIAFITLAGTTQSFAKTYDSACGEYVSEYAAQGEEKPLFFHEKLGFSSLCRIKQFAYYEIPIACMRGGTYHIFIIIWYGDFRFPP